MNEIEDIYTFQSQKVIAEIFSNLYKKILPAIQQDERERTAMLSYISGKTFGEIGKDMDISAERVRQIIHNTLEKIKQASNYDELVNQLKQKDAELEKMKLAYLYGGTRKVSIDKARLADYNLSVRTINSCEHNRIYTISDLVKIPKNEFRTKAKIGKKTLDELDKLMKKLEILWPTK